MAAKPWHIVPLVLPVDEKEYVVQPLDYRDGLTLIATMKNDEEKGIPSTADGDELYRLCVGPTWDQMLEDGCPHPVLARAGDAAVQYQTSLVVFGQSCEVAVDLAEKVWAEGLDPEAVAAILAAQQTEKTEPKKTSKRSISTAAASETQPPASTSGTRSRRATPRTNSTTAPAKRPRSSGARSSSAGRSS